jgi:formate/nitrite transporter FocA (FNT family)
VVALGGFTHIVAGSVEVFHLMTKGGLSFTHGIFGDMVPTFTGNVIGGIALVATLNHAQAVAGRDA